MEYRIPKGRRALPHLFDETLGKTLCGREPGATWVSAAFVGAPAIETCYNCYSAWDRARRAEAWSHRYDGLDRVREMAW